MPSTGTAYITGFAPLTDKGVIPGIGPVKERDAKKPKSVSSACTGTVVAYGFIGNDKTVVLKTKPLAAFGTMNGMNPVYDMGDEENANNDQGDKRYVAHETPFYSTYQSTTSGGG